MYKFAAYLAEGKKQPNRIDILRNYKSIDIGMASESHFTGTNVFLQPIYLHANEN